MHGVKLNERESVHGVKLNERESVHSVKLNERESVHSVKLNVTRYYFEQKLTQPYLVLRCEHTRCLIIKINFFFNKIETSLMFCPYLN